MAVAFAERRADPGHGLVGWGLNAAASALQFLTGLCTWLFIARLFDPLTRPPRQEDEEPQTPFLRLLRSVLLAFMVGAANVAFFVLLIVVSFGLTLATGGSLTPPPATAPTTPATTRTAPAGSAAAAPAPAPAAPQANAAGQLASNAIDLPLFVWALLAFRKRPLRYAPVYGTYGWVVQGRVTIWLAIFRLLGTVIVCGLSLLPLSALLLAFPAINPQESVLTEAVSGRAGFVRRTLRRVVALATGLTVFLILLALSVEAVTRLPLPKQGSFAVVAKTFMFAPADFMGRTPAEKEAALANIPEPTRSLMKTPLHEQLPPAMVEHWPFVILGVYIGDLIVLLAVGKVPLAYNLRNVRVRWKTNAMTAFAFTCVIGLMVFLLAFVNGMNNLTENSGVPGNVFVLSDGSTDEVLSNLGYGDLDNVERVVVTLDAKNKPLAEPVRVATVERDGRPKFLASRETYYNINQLIPLRAGEWDAHLATHPEDRGQPPRQLRRRFVQVRSVEDPEVSAAVHNVDLYPGGRWFSASGVDGQSRIECVLGEGVAGVLGEDQGKKRLQPGDEFVLGDEKTMRWVVTGVMRSEGKTFGSEVWVRRFNRITKPFGKENYTTLVLRTEQDTIEASRAMAHHLGARYTQQKLKAFAEPDYFAELTKTNNFFLTAVVIVAVVMAIGGVFGMMTTMFASIAQRIRDIGVLRLLGFKRWQVTISFLIESLTIAAIGGAVGCFVAWFFADGKSSVSTLSGGGGGPGGKSFALTIDVDAQVMALGMTFTLVMGRLGGLVPAMSAMRMKILDSLR